MTAPSPSVRTPDPQRHPWRNGLLWTAFVFVLVGGLVLAAVFGGSAPILLDSVRS
jgi:uncharacterized BrkB/YihY/UPF0761 family membrane protein